MARDEERPVCVHCRHFYVTWEPDRPRGCRAYGFKSAEVPSEVVLSASGERCQLFERRRPTPPHAPSTTIRGARGRRSEG